MLLAAGSQGKRLSFITFAPNTPHRLLKTVSKSPQSRPFTVPSATIALPAWEREYEQERGLVGTSYESATVEQVNAVGDGLLKIAVDTAVTCTSQQYTSEGQFLFLKPWGDEDGSIEPCCFTAPPGNGTLMEFFVAEESAVGAAALAGEMLEVSEVMGDGFATHLLDPQFLHKDAVFAVCSAKFCMPALAALRTEQRPATLFVPATNDGPFAPMAAKWAEDAKCRAVCLCQHSVETSLEGAIKEFFEKHESIAVLLSADAQLCQLTGLLLRQWDEHKSISVFTP